MKILLCVEFYFPSIGGAQEVVRQVAERLVRRGHTVTVATTELTTRCSLLNNGVKIAEFAVAGNRVRGLKGEVDRYQSFLMESQFDLVMFYATQQWTFDAACPVISKISARKALVPCGYSNLYEPSYASYFSYLPSILRQMDVVIYHAEKYRDIDFAKSHGIHNDVVVPNGADIDEFKVAVDTSFRESVGVDDTSIVLLTVGSLTGLKGHLELATAYEQASFGSRKSVLILNGNAPGVGSKRPNLLRHVIMVVREYGWMYIVRRCLKLAKRVAGKGQRHMESLQNIVDRVNSERSALKRIVMVDLSRTELIQAYLNSDLFVFASHIEYSPLVLYEACAAGTPFLASPAGNAAEIAAWTGGGEIFKANADPKGYIKISPSDLARHMEQLLAMPQKLNELGVRGCAASRNRFNWEAITSQYETLFYSLSKKQK
ncbi:glycosyltransferase family 4 protein [Alcaligenaceae bacterium]|nr:glycosyltransferase family 4 protein [Alcaligenaceae bacterium]